MIQLNLLPDVKMLYIKAQRQRRIVMSVSFIVTAAGIALLLLMLSVNGLQKKHLSDLSKDIKDENSQLQKKPNIGRVLTVQNQLQSLTALHDDKPAASQLFEYLNQVTPASVSINTFSIDLTQDTMTITGTSDSLANVNQYVDTLKKSTYTTGDNKTAQPAFSNVVLSSFGLNSAAKDVSQAANYTINLSYDKTIFDITQKVTLSVPTINTRAQSGQTGQTGNLFEAKPVTPSTGGTR
jgi:Tfp pilus assembly protein PilN